MKLTYLKTASLNQRIVQLFSIQNLEETYFTYLIADKYCSTRYQSSQVYATELEAYQSALFFCLRADLDYDPAPAMIIERESGYILATNLQAYKLLAMDAEGLQLLDFAADAETAQLLKRCVQQAEEFDQSVFLYDADGCLLKCQADAAFDICLPKLGIVRLQANR